MPQAPELVFEDAEIIFKNFAGKEGQYNRPGDRNFNLVLDPELAAEMVADGWNIKALQPRDEGDEPRDIVEVAVSYKIRPPTVILIAGDSRTRLDEEHIELLDWADIKNVDLVIRGYPWDVNGKQGIKAYLKSIYVTIHTDPLEQKYRLYEDPPQEMDD